MLLGMQVLGMEAPLAAGSCSSTGNTPELNPRGPPFPSPKLKAKRGTVRPHYTVLPLTGGHAGLSETTRVQGLC